MILPENKMMLLIGIGLICALLFWCFWALLEISYPSYGIKKDVATTGAQYEEGYKSRDGTVPYFTDEAQGQSRTDNRTNQKKEQETRQRIGFLGLTNNDWIALFTGLLFIATVLLFLAAKSQISLVQEQLASAKDANNISREAMISQRRPWLIPSAQFTQITFHGKSPAFEFIPSVQNVGESVATSAYVIYDIYPVSIANGLAGGVRGTLDEAFRKFSACLLADPPEKACFDSIGEPDSVFRVFPMQQYTLGQVMYQPGFELSINPNVKTRAINPVFFIGVSYRIPHSDERYYTISIYNLGHLDSYSPLASNQINVSLYRARPHWVTEK